MEDRKGQSNENPHLQFKVIPLTCKNNNETVTNTVDQSVEVSGSNL